MPLLKIAIVEDKASIREDLTRYLNDAPGFRCVCACASAEQALQEIPGYLPDVVLLDIRLPGMSGVECAGRLKKILPTVPIIMLTVYDENDLIFEALKAGASGYLLKRTPPARILEAIVEVHQGGAPMTSEIARKVVDSFIRPPTSPLTREAALTPQEERILDLFCKGYVAKEVAERLGISYQTARTHQKNIYAKLHVRTQTEAVLAFMQSRKS
jgi:DNA-binding NarL/FixJ family response regulator